MEGVEIGGDPLENLSRKTENQNPKKQPVKAGLMGGGRNVMIRGNCLGQTWTTSLALRILL